MLEKIKKALKNNKTKVLICGVIIVVAAFGIVKFNNSKSKNAFANTQRTEAARIGDITVTVSGSGPIESSARYEITPSLSGKIKKVYYKEGDRVKAGDLIAEIDDTDGRQNISQVQNSIREQNLNKLSDGNNLSNLKVTSPMTGYVSNITAKDGDNLGKNSPILTVIDKSRFTMNCDFREVNMTNIKKGTKVKVFLTNFLTYLDGTVSYVSDKGQLIDDGGILHKVEVTVDNPGYSLDGANATIELNQGGTTVQGENSGTFSYANSMIVKTLTGGTLKKLYVKDGEYVVKGQVLVQFDNQDLKISQESSNIKQQELNMQLSDARDKLDDYKIYAHGDGVIVSQDLKGGDLVKQGDVVSTVSDKDNMQFDISIDELDIAKIKIGQKATITVDALPDTTKKPLTGSVVKIAEEGTSTNGVTTYPVTVKIDDTTNLKAGMNANAEILIKEKKDVLIIPIEAVTKLKNRSFVTLKNQDNKQNYRRNSQKNNQRKNGNSFMLRANLKPVELGISNEEYIEVISGLNEGDEVVLPNLAANTTQSNLNQMRMPFGGMGGGQSLRRNSQSQGSIGSSSRTNRGE